MGETLCRDLCGDNFVFVLSKTPFLAEEMKYGDR